MARLETKKITEEDRQKYVKLNATQRALSEAVRGGGVEMWMDYRDVIAEVDNFERELAIRYDMDEDAEYISIDSITSTIYSEDF